MNFRKLLKDCENSENKLKEIQEEREKYKTRAEKMTATFSDTTSRTNITSDKVADNAIELAKIDDKLKELEVRYSTCRLKVLAIITELDAPYYDILKAMYLDGLTLKEYADKKAYSYYRMSHVHGEALQRADDIARVSNF